MVIVMIASTILCVSASLREKGKGFPQRRRGDAEDAADEIRRETRTLDQKTIRRENGEKTTQLYMNSSFFILHSSFFILQSSIFIFRCAVV